MIRVLVVDDSAFARKVLRQVLGASPALEVVGYARDGLEALEKIEALSPDVITLDLMMPNLDGLGVLRHLRASALRPAAAGGRPAPKVVLVSSSQEESELVVEALELGAVSMVRKPTAQATDRLYALSDEVTAAVIAAAVARVPVLAAWMPGAADGAAPLAPLHGTQVLAIGTSTGGPQALSRLLADLPDHFPVPVVIALHIPGEYTEALARRLGLRSPLTVVEAHDGVVLAPGLAVLAKGGMHLRLERQGGAVVGRVEHEPASSIYHPSVDVLLGSAAQVYGRGALGVVLTGMGDDGTRGARAIVAAGGRVFTEAEGSCVVYGMPRVVKEAGLSSGEARIEAMGAALVRWL